MSELAIATPVNAGRIDLAAGYSSLRPTDVESKKRIFMAVTNALSLSDNLGLEIPVVDVITQPVESLNDQGEIDEYTRTVLISEDGTAFAAGSDGILTALHTLLAVFGTPDTWAEPVVVKAVEKKGKKYKFMSLETV